MVSVADYFKMLHAIPMYSPSKMLVRHDMDGDISMSTLTYSEI